jgi:hypothetical protein
MSAVQVLKPSEVAPLIFQVRVESQHEGTDVRLFVNVNG